MNSSAKMRRRVAVLTLLSLFVGVFGFALWVTRHAPSLPSTEISTLHLPDPVELTDGDTTLRVTRIALHPRHGWLTLEQDELTFDDYGDATRTGGKPPRTILADVSRDFRLTTFTIRSERRFVQRLRLAALPGSANTYRLIVLSKNRHGNETFERILELRGPEIVPDELGDAPQPERFTFETLGHGAGPRGQRLYGIGVSGSLAGGGQLSIDPNYYMFHPDGSVGGSTCLGWALAEVAFKPLGPDPANRGRRAFALAPTKAGAPDVKGEYILVLGPTELSEHRLVIKQEGRVTQVLPLRNTERDNHLFMLRKLDGLPDEEQRAFRDLGKAGWYRALVEVNNGHVVGLHRLDGDIGKLDPILARFPHLGGLGFMNATLPTTGLPCLERLKELRALSFTSCELSDDVLASVGKATGLRLSHAFGSTGLTPANFRHLAPLTNLESLDLRHENAPRDAPIFDDGVKHFAGMTRLTYLNLQGKPLTDAGLAHIGRLTTLRELYVSGSGITDAGLKHLDGLTELTVFAPYSAGVSVEALTAFRKKRPNLRQW